jgi:hypothetical protein
MNTRDGIPPIAIFLPQIRFSCEPRHLLVICTLINPSIEECIVQRYSL